MVRGLAPGNFEAQARTLVLNTPEELQRLSEALRAEPSPVLLLAADAEGLVALLRLAREDDEVALASEPEAARGLRLHRLAQRRRQQSDASVSHDPLTGLKNRRAAMSHLSAIAATSTHSEGVHAAVLIDIDHFKRFNDQYGHAAGDAAIVRIAQTLRAKVREADLVARMGGEEFLLVLHRDTPEDFHRELEQLRHRVATLAWSDLAPGLEMLTISLGVAFHVPSPEPEAWLEQANQALYAAKAAGRNRTVYAETLAGATDDPAALRMQHFENVTRVVTERVASLVSLMGKQMLREMQREAQKDALTGIANRGLFDRRMARELALCAEDGRPLSLLLLDIDHFGRFNREHGVPTGDAVLKQFAQTVALAIRPNDWVARYGGEEFCVVMPADLPSALQAAERLRSLVAGTEMRGQNGEALRITVSAGVAQHLGAGESLDDLVLRASKALQAGKKDGRNRVVPAP